MTASFQIQHRAMLLEYSGISFISGAVNHGFFSGKQAIDLGIATKLEEPNLVLKIPIRTH